MSNKEKWISYYEYYRQEKNRKRKRKNKIINFLWAILRIPLFPIFLLIRIFRWTYYMD